MEEGGRADENACEAPTPTRTSRELVKDEKMIMEVTGEVKESDPSRRVATYPCWHGRGGGGRPHHHCLSSTLPPPINTHNTPPLDT